MTVHESVIFLLVGAICAAIAQSILGVRTGLLGSIVIGWLGAFVGTYIARKVGMPELFVLRIGTGVVPIVWTIVGSFVLVAIVGLLRRAP